MGGFNDFGLPTIATPRDVLARGPLRNEFSGTILDRAPRRRAYRHAPVAARPLRPPDTSRAWNIGIEIRPSARGKGYGAEAQRMLADWLFVSTDANRVEAQTDIENIAEQHSLDKAGFSREGVTRACQYRAGEYHDLVMYSRVRSD